MPRSLSTILFVSAFLLRLSVAHAQQPTMPDMPGMDMGQMPHDTQTPMKMNMMEQPTSLIDAQLNHLSSGTSIEPASTPINMIMSSRAGWMLMLHGTAFVANIQQQASEPQADP